MKRIFYSLVFSLLIFSGISTPISAIANITSAEGTVPVYRFRNNQLGSAHFYTADETQKTTVINNSKSGGVWAGVFTYEQVAFKAYSSDGTSCTIGDPVYRFRNNILGSAHFYTADETQKTTVENNSAAGGIWEGKFTYEGVAFCAYLNQETDTKPVYRFRNNKLGSAHFYTIEEEQKNTVQNNSKAGGIWDGMFTYEQIAFYAFENETEETENMSVFSSTDYNFSFEHDSSLTISNHKAQEDSCTVGEATLNAIDESLEISNGIYMSIYGCSLGAGNSEGNEDEPVEIETFAVYTKNGIEMNIRSLYSPSNPESILISTGYTTTVEHEGYDFLRIFNMIGQTDEANYNEFKASFSAIVESMTLDLG